MIARAIRDLGVYSEIYAHDITPEEVKNLPNVKGIILNGGENNIIDGAAIDVNPALYALGIPVMAVGHAPATCETKHDCWPVEGDAVKCDASRICLYCL